MNIKKPTAPVLLTYAVLSVGLSVFNYYFAFMLTDTILKENFSVNIFLIGVIIFIMIESILIAEITKSKLLAVLGTTTLIAGLLNSLVLGLFSLFYANSNPSFTSVQNTLGYLTLNIFFLIFSYLGALIGLQLAAKSSKSKKRKS